MGKRLSGIGQGGGEGADRDEKVRILWSRGLSPHLNSFADKSLLMVKLSGPGSPGPCSHKSQKGGGRTSVHVQPGRGFDSRLQGWLREPNSR